MNDVIYAHWEKTIYTITLNQNNGSGGTSAVYEWYSTGIYGDSACNNAAITSITKPTRTGYTFKGYFLNNDGTGTKYINEDGTINTTNFTKTTFTTNKTIYAQWEKTIYTITLNQNNGSGGTSVIYEWYNTGIYGDSACNNAAITSITKPIRTGYIFKGFYTNNDGTGTKYINEDGTINTTNFTKTTFTTNKTIYAYWESDIYTITFDSDGATNIGTTTVYEKYNVGIYGNSDCSGTIINSITIPNKNKFLFGGYYDEGFITKYVNENGVISFNKTTFTENTTLKAKWIPIYKITFDSNGGSGVLPNEVYITKGNTNIPTGVYTTYECNTQFTSLTTLPTKTNSTFKGFVANASSGEGSGTEYIKETGQINATNFVISNFTSDTTIYAKWNAAIYIITLDNNGANTAGTTVLYEKYDIGIYNDITCTGAVVSSITKPIKTGYSFKGYFDNDGLIKYINEDGTINTTNFTKTAFSNNTILKAKWETLVCVITLDMNGGTGGTTTLYQKYNVGIYSNVSCVGAVVTSITKPIKSNYNFLGYFDNDGLIKYINEDGTINVTNFTNTTFVENITLKAKWANNINMITLDANGGVGGSTVLYEKYNVGIYADSGCVGTIINSITKPTKTGYTFKGYFDNGGVIKYINEDGTINTINFTKTTFTSDVTLKAIWETNIYEISLDINGGDITGTNKIYEKYGVGFYLDNECTNILNKIIKPANGILVCEGFYENNNGTGIKYINEDGTININNLISTTFTSNVTMYANYTNKYVITLDAAGGNNSIEVLYKQENGSVYINEICTNSLLNISKPIKAGYIFQGYFTENDGQGIKCINNNGNILANQFANEDITIYAFWEKQKSSQSGGNGGGKDSTEYYSENVINGNSSYVNNSIDFQKEKGAWDFDLKRKRWRFFTINDKGEKVYYNNKWLEGESKNGKKCWYVFDAYGGIMTGWVKHEGEFYYMSPDSDKLGEMMTGEIVVDGVTYKTDPNTGKLIDNSKPQNFEVVGVVNHKTGQDGKWVIDEENNTKMFMSKILTEVGIEKEEIAKGWLMIDGNYYYFNEEGKAETGLIISDGKYYYFDKDGKMVEGEERIVDGVTYVFDKATGACRRSYVVINK